MSTKHYPVSRPQAFAPAVLAAHRYVSSHAPHRTPEDVTRRLNAYALKASGCPQEVVEECARDMAALIVTPADAAMVVAVVAECHDRDVGLGGLCRGFASGLFAARGDRTARRIKDAFLAENPTHKKEFARLKGLGEMDAEELWATTMDPARRTLLQISVEHAVIADEVFSILMGEDVESRKHFIQTNATDVRFLDI